MADNAKTIDVLKNLLETCRDGQEGYRQSAENVNSPEFKSFFNEQSLTRGRFVGEIENELHRLGELDVDRSGSIAGSLHRTWIDLKSNVGMSDEAILSSVERGEDTAKSAYQK